MTVAKITKTVVDRMEPGTLLWDTVTPGFGVRRQASAVVYVVRYRHRGQQYQRSLGRHGVLTPDEARQQAKVVLGEVARGLPPEKRTSPFKEALDRYLRQGQWRARTRGEVERHLLKQAEHLHQLTLAEIDRKAIADCLAKIEQASGPVARNRARSSLSGFFAWCIREGLTETNPVAGTGKAKEQSRDRVLTTAEIAQAWGCPGVFGDIVRLLLLTGQRRSEIGGLRWDEVDLDAAIIRLPASRTKNGREHVVPLAPAALAIVRAQKAGTHNATAVFPRIDWSAAKARLGGEWTLHDLRRTAATGMIAFGTPPHIVEAVLNHVSGARAGVAGVYNRHRYEAETAEALERWADHLGKVVITQD